MCNYTLSVFIHPPPKKKKKKKKTSSRVCENQTLHVKSHSACVNRILRVEINLVRVEITIVCVVITFVPVEITLRVEITLCV
jgi:hypothetical protein